jgi:hypothetical protein
VLCGSVTEVPFVEGDNPVGLTVDSRLKHHVVIWIGKRWTPQKRKMNGFCHCCHRIEHSVHFFGG